MDTSRTAYIRLGLHVLIWVLLSFILLSYPSLAHKGVDLPRDFMIKQIVHLFVMLAAYYLNVYVLVPHLLLRKRYILFGLTMLMIVFLAAYGLASVGSWLNLHEQMKHVWGRKTALPYFDQFGFLTTLITLGISTSISAINKLNQDSKRQLRLEKEKATTELNFLKAQIHPHFFFNTLNSIYSLSYTDADGSRKILTKLSKMMRYLLYETNQGTTTLDKELTFIRNYIEIMRIRLHPDVKTVFCLPETVLPVPIAPMIFQPYIENVFKHGVDDKTSGELYIYIAQNATGVQLVTRNPIAVRPDTIPEDASQGIGMQNTMRRLELLYKDKYELSTQVPEGSHTFELILQLNLL